MNWLKVWKLLAKIQYRIITAKFRMEDCIWVSKMGYSDEVIRMVHRSLIDNDFVVDDLDDILQIQF